VEYEELWEMNRQYQKYLNKTKQEPPKPTVKKYFTVPVSYPEFPDNLIDEKIDAQLAQSRSNFDPGIRTMKMGKDGKPIDPRRYHDEEC
jgi:hypothetical protein